MASKYEVEKFLAGEKPMLLCSKFPAKYLVPLFEKPRYDVPLKEFADENGVVPHMHYFFQNEEQKEAFLRDYENAKTRQEKCRVEGLYLGFPPKAVDWWVNTVPMFFDKDVSKIKKFDNERTSILYGATRFLCSKYDVEECIRWLWDNAPSKETALVERILAIKNKERDGKKVQTVEAEYRAKIPYRNEEILQEVLKSRIWDWNLIYFKDHEEIQ